MTVTTSMGYKGWQYAERLFRDWLFRMARKIWRDGLILMIIWGLQILPGRCN